MADTTKNLKIVLTGDTSNLEVGMKAAVGLLKDYEKQVNVVSDQEKKKSKIIEEQTIALAKLKLSIDKINSAERLNDTLALNAAISSLRVYNETIARTSDELRKLNSITIAGVPKATADNRGYTPLKYGTVGESRASAEAAQKAEFDAVEAALQKTNARRKVLDDERNNAIIAREQQVSNRLAQIQKDRLAFSIQAEEAANKARLASMRSYFTTAFADEKYATSKSLDSNTKAVERNASLLTHITEVDGALNGNTQAVERNVKAYKSLLTHITEVYGAYQLLNIAASSVKQFLLDIPKTGIQQEQTQASLFAIFGSKEGYKDILFLKDLAKDAGQYIGDLQEAYTRFAPSAVLAGASQKEVNQIFKDFTETSTVLHLSTDQVKSLYLALEQMYAKTTVQSEEIKKQLGNVLPGAVEIGAQAWAKYTKSADKSVAAFMEAMKKNEVLTKQFVPEFAKAYREAFGGPDDAVFLDTRTKLLSNLQRIRTDYFGLSEEIYKQTASSLNDIVKLGGSALETIQKNAAGVLQVIEILSVAIAARLSASLVTGLLANLEKISVLLTGVSASILAVSTAAVTAAASITGLSVSYEEARGILLKYRDDTASITSVLAVVYDDTKTFLTKLLTEYKGFGSEFLQAILPDPVKAITDFFKTYIPLTLGYLKASKQVFTTEGLTLNFGLTAQQYAKEYAETFDTYGANVIQEAVAKDIEKTKAYAKGKSVYEVGKIVSEQLAAGLKLSSADISGMFANALDIPATTHSSSNEPLAKLSTGAVNKAFRTAIAATNADLKQGNQETKTALAELDQAYKNNVISIEVYFTRKQQLQADSLNKQIAFLEKEKAVAAQYDKTDKAEEIQGRIDVLAEKRNTIETETFTAKNEALKAYNTLLQETEATYLKLIGQKEIGVQAAFTAANKGKIGTLMAQYAGGDAGAGDALKQYSAIEKITIMKGTMADADERIKLATEQYNAEIQKTNTLYNVGAVGQLTALSRITAKNEEYIRQLEEQLAIEEESLRITKEKTGAVDPVDERRITALRDKIEELRLTSDQVASHFEKVFGDAFSSSFEAYVMGTQSAGKAFQSFVGSVLQGIAKIAAQEASTAILSGLLKPLASAAWGGLTGAFSSGALSFTSSTVAPTTIANTASSANVATRFLADGGVMSGAGISAHSGTIVSTPTVFPFANGVGLMGEAGPEAILPLRRNSQGKLGIIAGGNTGQNVSNEYNIAVTVQSSKNESPADLGQKIGEGIIRTIAREEIANAKRPGNTLNRSRFM